MASELDVLNVLRNERGFVSARDIRPKIDLCENTVRSVLYRLEANNWVVGKVFLVQSGGLVRKYKLSPLLKSFEENSEYLKNEYK